MTELTCARLKEIVGFDATTGEFIWRKNGLRAGSFDKSRGYFTLWIDGRSYLAHRLAWLYEYGEFPHGPIDHANLVRSDNRISNLRITTQSQNIANTRKRSDNASGFKGVVKRKNRWRAQITHDRKTTYLGSFETPHEAQAAYMAAATVAFGEFARVA